MTLNLITAPATEPVTLSEAKAQCRVDAADEDALITALITAARQEAEHALGRSLITQTWERVLEIFPPDDKIKLCVPPVASITSIVYIDAAGATQTLSASYYELDAVNDPGLVRLADGYQWPSTADTVGAVKVRFVAGYGNAAAVPQAIKTWLLMRVATLYKFREESVLGVSVTEVPGRYTDRLLDPFRVWC
jgi:uncharacterized phiE125 gp8 family phage protein